MTTMAFNLSATPSRGQIEGTCAKCDATVYESLLALDDVYNVWMGKCPHCGALNFLSLSHGLRGYSSQGMYLILPTDEEKEANDLPKDCPTSGPCGKPANIHGSNLGELAHKLTKGEELKESSDAKS